MLAHTVWGMGPGYMTVQVCDEQLVPPAEHALGTSSPCTSQWMVEELE